MAGAVVLVRGWCSSVARLQPWRYLTEVAAGLEERGSVLRMTDDGGATEADGLLGAGWECTDRLRPWKARSLAAHIAAREPDVVLQAISWGSWPYAPLWRRLAGRVTVVLTSPPARLPCILSALMRGVAWRDVRSLLLQQILPLRCLAWALRWGKVERVVVMTDTSRDLLLQAGVPTRLVHVVPVGTEDGEPVLKASTPPRDGEACRFLYLGAATRIRGIDVLLRAVGHALDSGGRVHLTVLDRGAAGGKTLERRIKQLGIGDHVNLVPGWLEPDEVMRQVDGCDAVVQPFLLVPSEEPVAIVECMLRGKPVIVSDAGSLPGMVRSGGVVVPAGDWRALSGVLLRWSRDCDAFADLGRAAQLQAQERPTWHQTGERVAALAWSSSDPCTS